MSRNVVLAIGFVFLVAVGAQAGIIPGSFNCYFPDDPATAKHSWTYSDTESLLNIHEGPIYAFGPDSVIFSGDLNGDPTFRTWEEVINSTGYAWTSYELTLPTSGNATFVNDAWTQSNLFSSWAVTPYKITFSNGSVPAGNPVEFQFKINVADTSGSFNYCLTQTPVPEPGTLALLLGGCVAGLGVALRKRLA